MRCHNASLPQVGLSLREFGPLKTSELSSDHPVRALQAQSGSGARLLTGAARRTWEWRCTGVCTIRTLCFAQRLTHMSGCIWTRRADFHYIHMPARPAWQGRQTAPPSKGRRADWAALGLNDQTRPPQCASQFAQSAGCAAPRTQETATHTQLPTTHHLADHSCFRPAWTVPNSC